MSITTLTALTLAARLHAGEIKIAEALDAYYAAIDASENNCWITLCKEQAYARGLEIQARLDAGEVRSPLAGVPIAVRDSICTKDIETTCASEMLRGFVPPFDAAVIEKINAADMLILGKTNMDEFAMGFTTETSAWGPVKNPRDPAHTAGDGAAAAVAAGEAPIALGSDTGGAIRQSAAHCGVTGLRPTYGAVSRHGLVAHVSSLDQIGPIGRSARDCAALFDIIRGKDERDGTSVDADKAHFFRGGCSEGAGGVRGLRIGIPNEFFGEDLHPGVAKAVLAAKDNLTAMGAQAGEYSLSLMDYAIPTYYIIACAEASSNLSRYDGITFGHASEKAQNLRDSYLFSRGEGFGMEAKRRVMLGNLVLSSGCYEAYYKKALQAKRLIRDAFTRAFENFDLILGPVAPTAAPRLGESLSDPPQMYLGDIYTVMPSLAGLPAVSIPCGKDSRGLPVGFQLIGRPFAEGTLLGVAGAYHHA